MVYVSVGRRTDSSKKDTIINIEQTWEFVANLVVEEIIQQMNTASGYYPLEVSEFQITGLTPVPSDLVKPPRVLESPVNLECRVSQILEFRVSGAATQMVLGKVLRLHVDDSILTNGAVDLTKYHPVGRMGPGIYTHTGDRFEMESPPQVRER